MSAYQTLKKFIDEVEKLTGVRPDVHVSFHSTFHNLDEQESAMLRNVIVADSGNELTPSEMILSDRKSEWSWFKADGDGIQIGIHGPHKDIPEVSAS